MDAAKAVKDIYSLEDLKEIADHGCQSGVCSQHIYYGDTIKFFDKYEDEITNYFTDNYDWDFLVNLFKDADADLAVYKNSVTWAFIEAVAMQRVDYAEEQELKDEETIGNYMKEEISNNGYTLADIQAQAAQLAEVFGS